MRKSSMSCIGRGLCRILSVWKVFGDTFEKDETNRKVCALLFFTTMKKILTLIFLSVFCMNEINALVTWNLSDDGTLTISGAGHWSSSWKDNTNIKIVIIEDGVTNISNEAFEGCTNLTSVSIPNSVTKIGYKAFSDCTSLTSINIPNSVTSIGYGAFSCCTGLTSINILNGITSIPDEMFWGCTSLTSVTIPNSVTSIGEFAFNECTSLTSINIPNSMTNIGSDAFTYSGLTSITIPNSVTSIGRSAFMYCSSLTSISISNTVTNIEENAFLYCTALASIVVVNGNAYYDSRDNCNAIIRKSDNTLIWGCKNTNIPNGVTNIGVNAFNACIDLTSITIPESVTNIDGAAFMTCRSLTSVILPNSVTNIGADAFAYSGLTSITIPNSVTSIGDQAFRFCNNLKKVTIEVNKDLQIGDLVFYNGNGNSIEELIMTGATLPKSAKDNSAFAMERYATLYVPSSLYNEYCSISPWNKFKNIVKIPDESIADGEEFSNDKYRYGLDITYTRTFYNTSWQALYIPFSMSYDDWKDEFDVAYINGIRQIDTNNDNVMDETIMDVFKIEEGTLIPNTPYLIRAKSTGEKTIDLSGITLYPSECNSIDCSTTIAKYIFTGTYNTIPASTLIENDYYAMGGGSIIMTDGESDLKPFRWYLSVEARSPMYYVCNNAKAITIRVAGEDEKTTGICQLDIMNNKLPVCDLNGRRVYENNLKPGIYVKNGKKVIIK